MSYKNKIQTKLKQFLTQGLSPEKIALTLGFGITLGIFPIIGFTSGLCVICASVFRLNQGLLQFINYLIYPLQIVLIIPFFQLGAWVMHDRDFTLNLKTLQIKFTTDFINALNELWTAAWHAALVWLIIAPILIIIVNKVSLPIIRKVFIKKSFIKSNL